MRQLFTNLKGVDSVNQLKSSASDDEIAKNITLSIKEEAYLKILKYVDLCDEEIGGVLFGTVNWDNGEIEIVDIDLPPQEVSPGTIEYDSIMPKAEDLIKLVEAKRNKFGVAQGVKMLGTWHSHVNMGVFCSVTDELCAKNFLATPPVIPNTIFVSLVFNKSKQLFTRIDVVVDKRTITYVEDATLLIDDDGKRFKENQKFNKLFIDNIDEFTTDEEIRSTLKEKLNDVFGNIADELVENKELQERIDKECEELFKKNIRKKIHYYGDFNNRGFNKGGFENYNGNFKQWKRDKTREGVKTLFNDKDLDPTAENLEKLEARERKLYAQFNMLKGKRHKRARKTIKHQIKQLQHRINRMHIERRDYG